MSDQTNEQRLDLARNLSGERERTARDLAIDEGRRRQLVDSTLNSHEERLDAINGSILRGAQATEANARATDALGVKIDGIAASHREQESIRVAVEKERQKVDEARTKALNAANAKQISSFRFTITMALAVLAVLIPLIALLLSIGGHK